MPIKKNIYFFLFIIFIVSGCKSGDDTVKEEKKLPPVVDKLPVNGTGEIYYKYGSARGKVQMTGLLKDGQKEGLWVVFGSDGEISKTVEYENGRKHGDFIIWYDKSQSLTNTYIRYKDDIRVGAGQVYYKSGEILKKGGFDEAGKKSGEWITYYKDHTVKLKEHFNKGKLEGTTKRLTPKGKMVYQGMFKNGKKNGSWTFYQEGVKFSSGLMADGKKNGRWVLYSSGSPAGFVTYDNGVTNGEAKLLSEKGKVRFEGFFQNNKKEGAAKEYDPDSGMLKGKGSYKIGLKVGPWIEYSSSGKKVAEGEYKSGNRVGEWKFYYENGSLKMKGPYAAGKKKGLFEIYRPDGTLDLKVTFSGMTIRDRVEIYSKNGKIKLREFSLGMPVFEIDEIFEDRSKSLVKKDNLKGLDIIYDASGNKKIERNWRMGDLVDTYKEFYPNGQVKISGKYSMGDQSGEWIYYTEDGSTQKTEKKGFSSGF